MCHFCTGIPPQIINDYDIPHVGNIFRTSFEPYGFSTPIHDYTTVYVISLLKTPSVAAEASASGQIERGLYLHDKGKARFCNKSYEAFFRGTGGRSGM
jgi:hypothetical protein